MSKAVNCKCFTLSDVAQLWLRSGTKRINAHFVETGQIKSAIAGWTQHSVPSRSYRPLAHLQRFVLIKARAKSYLSHLALNFVCFTYLRLPKSGDRRKCVPQFYPQLPHELWQINTPYVCRLCTNNMEQSPSSEANRSSTNQEIPRILWNPKAHYRIHNSPPRPYPEPDRSRPYLPPL
jgi:hypothetical protein